MNTIGAIPGKWEPQRSQISLCLGFLGVQAVGYGLHHGYEWPQILRMIGLLNILGNIVYVAFGSARRLV